MDYYYRYNSESLSRKYDATRFSRIVIFYNYMDRKLKKMKLGNEARLRLKKGLFVAMPQETNYNEETGEKEFLDICHPINTATRNKITKAVLDAYWDLLDKENDDEGYSE